MEDAEKAAAAADASAAADANKPQDEIKNLKAEMSRKLENTNAQLAKLIETMTAQLKPQPKPEAAAPAKKVSVFEDEEAYGRSILEEADKLVERKLTAVQAAQAQQQATISALVAEFPELNSAESGLTKKAVELYNGLSEGEKNTPVAYKLAVQQAALDLGIKPKSKRSHEEGDDYVMGGGAGAASSGRRSKSDELDGRTLEFAKLMGFDVSKPEVKERLKKRAARKSFTEWQ